MYVSIHLSIYLCMYLSIYLSNDSIALVDLDHFFSFIFLVYTQSVGHLSRGIRPSQGRHLHTEQHKQNKLTQAFMHDSSGIRIHDPSVKAGDGSSCLRPRDHSDRLPEFYAS
jgi:hypothetical protein